MALTFNGVVTALIDAGSESYEKRVKRIILFGGAVILGLILIYKMR